MEIEDVVVKEGRKVILFIGKRKEKELFAFPQNYDIV
jgi:hypothetical protein